MLLSFTAEKVRSYRDEVHLSMLGTRRSAEGVPRSVVPTGMTKSLKVLPAAGIFGANASGKTTILRAMDDMRRLVVTSFRRGSRGTPIGRRPFLLDPEYRDRPTRFEVGLLLDGVHWIYGFQVDDERVLEEFAYHWPRGRQARVFSRDLSGVTYGSPLRSAGRALSGLLRSNSLLLSVAGATGTQPLEDVFNWFSSNLRLCESSNRVRRAFATAELAQTQKERVMGMLWTADLGVADLQMTNLEDEAVVQLRRAISGLQDRDRDLEMPTPDEMQVMSPMEIVLTHAAPHGGVRLRPVRCGTRNSRRQSLPGHGCEPARPSAARPFL